MTIRKKSSEVGRSVSLHAPAKLNLHLGIYTELDERRYHRADSLMVALDLYDEVNVEELAARDAFFSASAARSGIQVICVPSVDVPMEKNTAYRAAAELAHRVARIPQLRITICKHVPDQAGMGGSSSDAAAVLRALCELWEINPADARVEAAARAVGADVPFFLDPVPTLLVGAGDVVGRKFAPLSQSLSVVLVRPGGPGVSTPAAYAAFDENPTPPADSRELCNALEKNGDDLAGLVAANLHNNLDPVACALLPKVAEVRAWLLAQEDVLGGQVTGSGSCVFAMCRDDADAQRIAQAARNRFGAWAQAAHIV